MNAILVRILERHRNLLLMSTALMCGGIAVYAGSRYVNEQVAQERLRMAPAPQQMVEVVVVTRALERGDTVGPEVMALREVPADYVPSAAIMPDEAEALFGQPLLQALRAGEIITRQAVASAEQIGFSARVKPGIRALTISVDEINSISGMLQPGDRIDLLLTARPPVAGNGLQGGQDATVPLLQNLLVMATGRQVRPGMEGDDGPRSFSAVTVEVSPQQAQRLIVAQAAGKLTAILRNPEDRSPLDARPLDLASLFGAAPVAQPRPRPAATRPAGPQIIVGGMGQASVRPLPVHSMPASATRQAAPAVPPVEAAHPAQMAQPMMAVPAMMPPAAGARPDSAGHRAAAFVAEGQSVHGSRRVH